MQRRFPPAVCLPRIDGTTSIKDKFTKDLAVIHATLPGRLLQAYNHKFNKVLQLAQVMYKGN
jgi:hypothetical protein